MTKKTSPIVPIALLAVVVLAGLWVMNSGEPAQTLAPGSVAPAPGGSAVTPVGAVSAAQVNSGELELFLKKSDGGTGITSSVLLLDASEWKGSESATRYAVMKTLVDKGTEGLKGYGGATPKVITVSTGEWSEAQLVGHIGDQLVVYTYETQATATAGDNVSTAKLMTLKDFYRETGKWVAQTQAGESAWNLYDYASYRFKDGSDGNVGDYYYNDAGSAATNAIITWYSRSLLKGEKLVDGSIWMEAPSNYSAKFKSLTVTDKYGHSKKYVTLSKGENFPSEDPRSVAASVLSTSAAIRGHAPASDWKWYFVGAIPDDFVTTFTAGDKNRLTWELETDTYGKNISVNFTVVQNTGAKGSTNGVFEMVQPIAIGFGSGAASGFNLTLIGS